MLQLRGWNHYLCLITCVSSVYNSTSFSSQLDIMLSNMAHTSMSRNILRSVCRALPKRAVNVADPDSGVAMTKYWKALMQISAGSFHSLNQPISDSPQTALGEHSVPGN